MKPDDCIELARVSTGLRLSKNYPGVRLILDEEANQLILRVPIDYSGASVIVLEPDPESLSKTIDVIEIEDEE